MGEKTESEQIVFHQEVSIQIRFNDIDLLGHVNNAIMQEYFDLGRMDYINATFGGQLFEGDKALIIASVHTDFLWPVFLHEQIVVKTTIVKIGTKSLKMVQHLVDKGTDTVKATCQSIMVGINKISIQSIEIPEEWRQKISVIEQRAM